jgi:hypothetical protein
MDEQSPIDPHTKRPGRRRMAIGVAAFTLSVAGLSGGIVAAHAASGSTTAPSGSSAPATSHAGTATPPANGKNCPGM